MATPYKIAEYMVQSSILTWCTRNNCSVDAFYGKSIRWLDPSSGAGIFPALIIKEYIKNSTTLDSLPRIHICEISEEGLIATLGSIIIELSSLSITIEDYYLSGKLEVFLGDTLELFPEQQGLGGLRDSFDIVIGNPPYVRSQRLSESYKKTLKSSFPSIANKSADLYLYFFRSALSILNKGGILNFITPAGYLKASHAMGLRDSMYGRAQFDRFCDLGEISLFENASLHACISTIWKSEERIKTKYISLSRVEELSDFFNHKLKFERRELRLSPSNNWAFVHSNHQNTSVSKSVNLRPLDELGFKIFSGIRTGCTRAFIVDAEAYMGFSLSAQDRWIRPIIMPRKINRWKSTDNSSFIIVIPTGVECNCSEVLGYLEKFKEILERRNEVSSGKCKWYQLRSCSYYDLLDMEKIVFPDISSTQRFSISRAGEYVSDGSFFIPSSNKRLLALFNSNYARQYFISNCPSVGNPEVKGRLRFKKEYVKRFPVPTEILGQSKICIELDRELDNLYSGECDLVKVEKSINGLVERLYQH